MSEDQMDHRGEDQTRRPASRRRPLASLLGLGLATALAATGCQSALVTATPSGPMQSAPVPSASIAQPSESAPTTVSPSVQEPSASIAGPSETAPAMIPQPTVSDLPVAAEAARVDLAVPTFSDPTNITNPLHPTSELHSVLLLGTVEEEPFRAEVTLLPGTRIMEWDGQRVETAVSQYAAYLDGRIQEVALDLYAQADDGSVWYFGEDVFNYEDGVVADTEGTWFAGKDGPAAMIMPAEPQVGDVYRPENIPGIVFEEVTVKSTDEAVDGPRGPVEGAIIVEELHMDGALEDKTFAPGYGEFFTGGGGDTEALALAAPIDALGGPMPPELETLSTGAADVFDAVQAEDWDAATATVEDMTAAWETLQSSDVPPLLEAQMSEAFDSLVAAVEDRDPEAAGQAAVQAAVASLDLELRHGSPAEIDLARLELQARQLLVDLAADDPAGVTGVLAAFPWVRDRFAHTLPSPDVSRIDLHLGELQAAAAEGDLETATRAAQELREAIAGLEPAQP